MALGVRLHKTPSEILDLPYWEYALLLGHCLIEHEDDQKAEAYRRNQRALDSPFPPRRPRR